MSNVIPLGNIPDPEPSGIPIIGDLLRVLVDIFPENMTVREVFDQLADMPIRDLLKELLP